MRKFKESYKQLKKTMNLQKMKEIKPVVDEKSGKVLWGKKKEGD